jgi:hypothetical protein
VAPADGTVAPRADSTAAAQTPEGAAENAGDDGVPVGFVAAAAAATLALVALLRRRLIPRRFRRSGDAMSG